MQALLTIAYDGASYAGWQRQTNALAVQEVLEETLGKIMKRPVTLRAASRTDAGVHALGQRAVFCSDGLKIPLNKFPAVVNQYLPPDIAVTAAIEVPDGFIPRFRAKQKTYRYQIYNAPCPNPLLRRASAFVPCPLNSAAMRAAAPYFIGKYDFKAFRAASPGQKENQSTVREIWECAVSEAGPAEPRAGQRADFNPDLNINSGTGNLITLTVTGDGFLYNMVRIIAGTVLYAGMGKIAPGDIPGIIASKDRTRAGKTMPPAGLTLMEVIF